ncbi:MAG: hypothetical protein HY000_10630 [Planctomycetes bacterium]|nr:hypothetical protein [Planctomycetota bacterium]
MLSSDNEDYGDEHRGQQPTEALATGSDRQKRAEMPHGVAKMALANLDKAAIPIVCGAMSLPGIGKTWGQGVASTFREATYVD